MQIHVAKNFVLLKPMGEQKLKSGLYAPAPQEDKPTMGTIYKVGEGKQPFDVPMKEGDVVIYKKYMANEIPVGSLGEVVNPVAFEDLTVLLRGK